MTKTHHKPKAMNADDIFDQYIKMIEMEAAWQQQDFSNVLNDDRSVYARVKQEYKALEKSDKSIANSISDQDRRSAAMRQTIDGNILRSSQKMETKDK